MSKERPNILERMFNSSFVIAAMATVAFYGVVHSPALAGSGIHRYTTSHAVEYVIVAFFMWGVIDVLFRALALPREAAALRHQWLPDWDEREPVSHARTLLHHVRTQPESLRQSRIGKRIDAALEHVVQNGAAAEYRERLYYLADQDDEHTRNNYALVRFVIWVSPVLGFLGTVIHFGAALAGISVKDMADRLGPIVNEMGSAFDTTCVALAASTTMMFCMFVTERKERAVLRQINNYTDRMLASRFESRDASTLPFLNVVQSANEAALAAIGQTLEQQVATWNNALTALFQRFDERQQHEWQGWQTALDRIAERQDAFEGARQERIDQLISGVEKRQTEQFTQLYTMVERITMLREDFAGFVSALRDMAQGEDRLVELQASLTTNLRVLHQTQQFDEALHGLTAAVHMLTARHRVIGPESAAA